MLDVPLHIYSMYNLYNIFESYLKGRHFVGVLAKDLQLKEMQNGH